MILFISPKHKYATNRIIQEAKKSNIGITYLSAQEFADKGFQVDITPYDVLFVRFPYPYFEQVIHLAKQFNAAGKRVVDASIAAGDADHGKIEMYETLKRAGLPFPKTWMLNTDTSPVYPFILKWTYGTKGKEVFLITNVQQLEKIKKKFPTNELLAQELIPAKYEYKIMTVNYKALPVILKFKTNIVTYRSDFKHVEVINIRIVNSLDPKLLKLITLAESAARATGRELAKVDIFEKQESFYILEVNRWPGFSSFEKLTGFNVGGEFMKYISG